MGAVSPALIKEVREKTGIGLLKCKEALSNSDGDVEKAIEELRKQGLQTAEKKASRDASEGAIFQYVHANGKIGVMTELSCETDFVARTEDFQQLGKDICMHIAAASPTYVNRDEVDADALEKEKQIFREQITGKPENIVEKIVDGKMNKFYEENCLSDQAFVKDDSVTIDTLVKNHIAKLGENIKIRRFVRLEMGK